MAQCAHRFRSSADLQVRRNERAKLQGYYKDIHEKKRQTRRMLEGGKIVGGESHQIKVGDVEFIPAGVPHGVSGVTGSITWLNIRFDTNY